MYFQASESEEETSVSTKHRKKKKDRKQRSESRSRSPSYPSESGKSLIWLIMKVINKYYAKEFSYILIQPHVMLAPPHVRSNRCQVNPMLGQSHVRSNQCLVKPMSVQTTSVLTYVRSNPCRVNPAKCAINNISISELIDGKGDLARHVKTII